MINSPVIFCEAWPEIPIVHGKQLRLRGRATVVVTHRVSRDPAYSAWHSLQETALHLTFIGEEPKTRCNRMYCSINALKWVTLSYILDIP